MPSKNIYRTDTAALEQTMREMLKKMLLQSNILAKQQSISCKAAMRVYKIPEDDMLFILNLAAIDGAMVLLRHVVAGTFSFKQVVDDSGPTDGY